MTSNAGSIETQHETQRVWRRRARAWLPWITILLLSAPIALPLIVNGLPSTGDGRLHLLRLEALDNLVRQGFFYPRWAPELALGYGYPVFNYYGPSSYALIEIFHLLGLSHVDASIATIWVITLVAGCGIYLLARDLFSDGLLPGGERRGEWAALAATVAYMYAPYFLTNMYMRGALAEAGAQALLPWILWSFRRLLLDKHPARYVAVAAFSLGGLAVTHNITLLWVPLLLAGYIAAVYWRGYGRSPIQWRRLGWVVFGGLFAMGVSAFFWLPLLLERGYLSTYAYYVSTYLIPYHNWTWSNFLDWHWVFDYTSKAPFQLGAIQLLLAVAGLLLLRRWNAEWVYLLVVALVSVVGIADITESLWLNNELLLIAQFPWRLLSILTLPLALFTGGLVTRLPAGRITAWGAGLLIALIVLFNHPPVDWLDRAVAADGHRPGIDLQLAHITQFELDSGAMGGSWGREFIPRWTDDFVQTPVPVRTEIDPGTEVTLTGVNPLDYEVAIQAPKRFKLILTNFYFPGWQAVLNPGTDREQTLETFPTTQQGLLTVEVPKGEHTLSLRWTGTPVQTFAVWLSLGSLLALGIFMIWQSSVNSGWAALPLALFILGAAGALKPAPAATPPQPVVASVTEPAPGLRLLGYRVDQPAPNQLLLFPYWFVQATPEDLRFRWLLTDAAGATVAETLAAPYFHSMRTPSWTAGSLVDDAYQLTLPPGLPAGEYQLWLQPVPYDGDPESAPPPTPIGPVSLEANLVRPYAPQEPVDLVFGDGIRLNGYDVAINGNPASNQERLTGGDYIVVDRGDMLAYTFYWSAEKPVLENYHSLLHLLDHEREPLLQADQLPGPLLNPPVLWNPYYPQPDFYRFTIPTDAPGGLYTPRLGLYRLKDGELLPISDSEGTPVGDSYFLPPVKIPAKDGSAPTQEVDARFDDLATLQGYDLDLPAESLAPGDVFTVTLHYDATGTTKLDYTQFVQLYSPELGMAAQVDRPPLAGGNPTSSWVSGETIVDSIPLQVFDDAQPGRYRLQVGLYDPATGERAPVFSADGAPLPDNQVILAEIEVQ